MQTLQNEDTYSILEKADSILGTKNRSPEKTLIKHQDKINDTTLSLVERLASENNNNKEVSYEEFKINHPLTGILAPSIIQNENREYALAHSSFIGYSIIKDTMDVNKYLTSNEIITLFPASTKFLWSRSILQNDVYGLTAITDSCRTIDFTNSDIESLSFKEKNDPLKFISSILGSKKYALNIRFNHNTWNQINKLFDNKSSHLLTIQINGNKYRSSITTGDLLNEIVLAEDLDQDDVDSIKVNYFELVKEE